MLQLIQGIPGEPCAGVETPAPLLDWLLQGYGGANALVFLSRLGSERLYVLTLGGGVGGGVLVLYV